MTSPTFRPIQKCEDQLKDNLKFSILGYLITKGFSNAVGFAVSNYIRTKDLKYVTPQKLIEHELSFGALRKLTPQKQIVSLKKLMDEVHDQTNLLNESFGTDDPVEQAKLMRDFLDDDTSENVPNKVFTDVTMSNDSNEKITSDTALASTVSIDNAVKLCDTQSTEGKKDETVTESFIGPKRAYMTEEISATDIAGKMTAKNNDDVTKVIKRNETLIVPSAIFDPKRVKIEPGTSKKAIVKKQ